MRPLIPLILLSSVLLASCGASTETTEVVTPIAKTPFYIETLLMSNNSTFGSSEKTGRITASSTLTLTSQGAGEIQTLTAKEGQYLKAGSTIATLKDTVNNYDIRYNQAQAALKSQEASIATTRINLDQSVENARIAYERARQAYETLTGKNALSYMTLVNTNSKTLDNYNESYRTYLLDTDRLMTQLLYEGDKILGMTDNYKYSVDGWKNYLGARIGNVRADAENKWNETYALRGKIRARLEGAKNINTGDFASDLELVSSAYAQIRTYIDTMLLMFQNNVIGGGLGQELHNGWISAWNGSRNAIQGSESGYNGWKTQTTIFFKGYKNSETATKLAVEGLNRALTDEEKKLIESNLDIKVTYENTSLDLRDRIKTAKLGLDQALQSSTAAQNLRDATLAQLETSKETTRLSLMQAERDYAKLRIITPVDGYVSKVIGNLGQSVSIGSPIIEFTGKQPQIVLDIEPSLSENLTIGQKVGVIVDGQTLTGVISALSAVTNSNLLSTIRISVADARESIGKTARVTFAQTGSSHTNSGLLLPLDIVDIIAEGEGRLRIYTATGVETRSVRIGKISGKNIEILESIDQKSEIIITNMSNYDPLKHVIEKKK